MITSLTNTNLTSCSFTFPHLWDKCECEPVLDWYNRDTLHCCYNTCGEIGDGSYWLWEHTDQNWMAERVRTEKLERTTLETLRVHQAVSCTTLTHSCVFTPVSYHTHMLLHLIFKVRFSSWDFHGDHQSHPLTPHDCHLSQGKCMLACSCRVWYQQISSPFPLY